MWQQLVSLESLTVELPPAREGSQWKNSVVGRLLARNAAVLTTDQFPGGRLQEVRAEQRVVQEG